MSKHQKTSSPSIRTFKGVGPQLEKRLVRLGIETLEDLLFHLPARYQDRTRITPVTELQTGVEAVVEADIVWSEIIRQRRSSLLCRIQDATGLLTLRFFHFNASQQTQLAVGARLRCFGEVRAGRETLEMIHPEYQLLDPAKDDAELIPEQLTLTPIYPATEGLHQRTLRNLIEQGLQYVQDKPLTDYLPDQVHNAQKLLTLDRALQLLHRPPVELSANLEATMDRARQRLAFEELLAHQLSQRQLRQQLQHQSAPELIAEGILQQDFLKILGFPLTYAQQRVSMEISHDLTKPYPMLRLLQGDVGSGKTVIAALAALQAIEAGRQVAIMVPTELLSEQHYQNFQRWLQPLGINIGWLTASRKGKVRKQQLEAIRSGDVDIAIGTHALFQDAVEFQALALIIVDEQHRFGVQQRYLLYQKGQQQNYFPHQLIMTATPIPRTLAMSAYASLDTSTIDELPPGRTPVTTVVIPESRRDEVIERIRLACQQGRQSYWVCTLIDESEVLQCQAAEQTTELLAETLGELRIGLIHGRLKAEQKEQIMADFKAAKIDLLVATTVIEVGVDVPNASLMIIENAERLGLAQLHQLRGRVGRGAQQSHCVLLYKAPLSEMARERLAVMRETSDGFVISQRDLELRGPGEVLGLRQTGLQKFKIADLARDQDLLPSVQQTADQLLREFPDNAEALIQRWLGDARDYGTV